MKHFLPVLLFIASSPFFAVAADGGAVTVAQMQDAALSSVEKEVVSLAEAMPADKYNFAPTAGAFTGVRTFSQQMSHIAAVLNTLSSALLGEKIEDSGVNENGPATLTGKEQVVSYLKESFARAHKAVKPLTAANLTESVSLPWGKMARGSIAAMCVAHTFDHYGQAVVYARMNNVVPPASRS